MQIKKLSIKALTTRNKPFQSPNKLQQMSIEIPNLILLGTIENVRIVRSIKIIKSLKIKEIEQPINQHQQNNFIITKKQSFNTKHSKVLSVQLYQHALSSKLEIDVFSNNSYRSIAKGHTHQKSLMAFGDGYISEKNHQFKDIQFTKLISVDGSGRPESCGINIKSSLKTAEIQFETGYLYVGQILIRSGTILIEGQGILYRDNLKWNLVYNGTWKSNCFHGKGKYYNQYYLEFSNTWHHQWKYVISQFSYGEIDKGVLEFYNASEEIMHNTIKN